MRVLLIEALKSPDCISRVYPPLGLGYLKSYAEKYADFSPDIIIVSTHEPPPIDKSNPPDLIGISAVTETFTRAVDIAESLREKLDPRAPVILGGCHISAVPESLPPVFDAAVIGEGERAFLQILNKLNEKGKLTAEDYAEVPGTAFFNQKSKTVLLSEPGRYIREVDTIPFPSRKILGLGITHMLTSRGCPYGCVYCATTALWGKVRAHSPAYVVEEIKMLYDSFQTGQIILFDDNFLIDKQRVKRIAQLLESRGIAGKIDFTCYGRTRAVTADLVSDLLRMGVTEIYLGADTVLDSVIEGRSNPGTFQRNERAIDLCHRAGLKVNCSFVIGLPCQTVDDLDRIEEFIERNYKKLGGLQISPLNLFPGTPIWDYAVARGKIDGKNPDFSSLENFTPINDFSMDNYIYLNEEMDPDTFTGYCKKFEKLTSRVNLSHGEDF